MKHARSDYDRIQDPANIIPWDEPVFLLRGQDLSAPETLRFWAMQNEINGGDIYLSELAMEQANAMEEWQKNNVMKPADL